MIAFDVSFLLVIGCNVWFFSKICWLKWLWEVFL